ncbi:hypothetical protein [Actinomadura miaoliensis]
MRAWATTHPAEFRWIFASPIPATASARNRPDSPATRQHATSSWSSSST